MIWHLCVISSNLIGVYVVLNKETHCQIGAILEMTWVTLYWTNNCFIISTHPSVALKVLNLQMSDGTQGDGHTDDTKLHGKPDKTLRFSLCSDNLEGISEGWSAAGSHVTLNTMQP